MTSSGPSCMLRAPTQRRAGRWDEVGICSAVWSLSFSMGCGAISSMWRGRPHLADFAARAERFPAYRTAFPSATRVVTATFATGCHPARHTLQGNSMALLEDGVLVPHDAGAPDFLQHKRAVNGYRSLCRPWRSAWRRMAGRSCTTTSRRARPMRMTRTATGMSTIAQARSRPGASPPRRWPSNWMRRATGR